MSRKFDPTELSDVDPGTVPVARDFRLALEGDGMLGMHVKMVGAEGKLAEFAYWDHADAYIAGMTLDTIPLGDAEEPHQDQDQGWEILIWENAGFVFVAEGTAEKQDEFERWFRVPKDVYLAEWEKLIAQTRAEARAFTSLSEALKHPDTAKVLRLGNQGLPGLPDEIGRLVHLEYLDMYLNKLTVLPDAFWDLKNLRWIDLRFNALTRLSESFGSLENLETINLAENKLTAIPACVKKMRKLRAFFVPGNPIPAAEIAALQRERPDLEIVDPSFS